VKNAVQYDYRSERWMVLTPERELLGTAMKERDAKLFAMAHEMFDLLKRFRDEHVEVIDYELGCRDIIQQIEPILSINNQEGE